VEPRKPCRLTAEVLNFEVLTTIFGYSEKGGEDLYTFFSKKKKNGLVWFLTKVKN
jgi:hypothetical protein